MNSNVLNVVAFIVLSSENVAGCRYLWTRDPVIEQQPSSEKPGDREDLKRTQDFNCLSPYLYHLWDQGYQNGSLQIAIGKISPQEWVKTTRFIIKEELIDSDTEIYCENSSKDPSKEKTTWRAEFFNTTIDKIYSFFNSGSKKKPNNESFKTLITIMANETSKENEEPIILDYNEKQNVSFSCHINTTHINKTKEYSNHIEWNEKIYVQLGLINTTSNMMETYERNSTHKIFNKTQNGTILCCVYYVVNATAEEKWITRYVAKKTLLLYSDTVQQDVLEGKEISLNNSTDTDSDDDSGHPTILIITSAVAAVFILLVSIVICKKRCRKKPELDTKVLYADLDILRQIEPDNFPRPGPEEESPYTQIIGVLRPQTK